MFTDAVEYFTVGSGGSGPAPGTYRIVSRDSGLVADVYARATNDGAQVVQWNASGGINQQWQFVPA
ncbi:RICIN domain-containing protein [Micromonospora sp. KC207]|uniref:RICIN domain-containing protein n=1 Tax=Micromonospora sp. KC207 TaxID=2530377 RepID=UPI0014053C7B|nr:RICIN domain-containing protein [Micromonospora sp. KC207]